jgi:hypothetical protein
MTTPPNSTTKRLLRLKAAATYLSVSPGALRGVIQRGELPIVRIAANAPWLVDVEDLNRWILQHKEVIE